MTPSGRSPSGRAGLPRPLHRPDGAVVLL